MYQSILNDPMTLGREMVVSGEGQNRIEAWEEPTTYLNLKDPAPDNLASKGDTSGSSTTTDSSGLPAPKGSSRGDGSNWSTDNTTAAIGLLDTIIGTFGNQPVYQDTGYYQNPQGNYPPTVPTPPKSRTGLYVGIGVGILAIAGVVIYMAKKNA
jgi:hypothetical protein